MNVVKQLHESFDKYLHDLEMAQKGWNVFVAERFKTSEKNVV
jgi:hypothetical protein